MNNIGIRRFEMMVRVGVYGGENAEGFPLGSAGAIEFATVNDVVRELERIGAAQFSGIGAGRHGTALKSVARENVREAMRAINRTARALALSDAGFDEKFRMPRGRNDQRLLNAARSFVDDAGPVSERFIAYGLPADFLEDLRTELAAFTAAVGERNAATDEHVAASAAIDVLLERGMLAVRRLRAIVPNVFRDDPAKLAAWTSASHVERAPRRQATPEPLVVPHQTALPDGADANA